MRIEVTIDGKFLALSVSSDKPLNLLLIDELEAGMLSLQSMPQRCPERQTGIYAGKGYRQLLVKNYTIIFRVEEASRRVIILTIRYSRSNF